MELRPLSGLTDTLRILLKINWGVTFIALWVGCYDIFTYMNLAPGADPNEDLFLSDVASGGMGLIQLVMFVVVGIAFLRWIYRANKNLRALSGDPMKFTPGWCVGWYFIPIFNLVRPYQAMKEIWRISHKRHTIDSSVLGWWWFLWIASHVLGRVAFKIGMRAEEITEHLVAKAAYLVADGTDVALTSVAIILVTRIGSAYAKNIKEPPVSPEGRLVTDPPKPVA